MILYYFICIYCFTPKCYILQGESQGYFGRSIWTGGLQGVQRLAARFSWRSGGRVMSVRSFRSKSGTHRALFEQMTSGEKTDCTVELRRPEIAGDDIKIAVFRDRPKS